MLRTTRTLLAMTAGGALLLSACGEPNGAEAAVASLRDGEPTTTTADGGGGDDNVTREEREQAMLDFAKCMREQGIDMPDPQFDDSGRATVTQGVRVGEDVTPEEMQAAEEACQEHLDGVRGSMRLDDPAAQAEMQEQVLAFAKCMREHGIDMPDPQFGDDGRTMIAIGEGVDPDDPDFQAANEACRGDAPFGPGAQATGGAEAGGEG